MVGTVVTEQAGEPGEFINKSPAYTPSRASAKSLMGSETRRSSPGLRRVVGSQLGAACRLAWSTLHPPLQQQQQRGRQSRLRG